MYRVSAFQEGWGVYRARVYRGFRPHKGLRGAHRLRTSEVVFGMMGEFVV